MVQKQKTEKKERRKEERLNDGNNNGQATHVSTAYGLYFCKYLPLNVALSVLRGLATRVARQHQLLAALLRPELNGTSTAAET